jgi:hypothetical protein
MIFTTDDLNRMRGELALVQSKRDQLTLKYLYRTYSNLRAREYATQGFVRRLSTLARCIHTVFAIIPPEQGDKPSKETKTDAEINLQAFTFNLYGALDNLAWIWVYEKAITKPNGQPLPSILVGLGRKNTVVRDSLSTEFRALLTSFDPWFKNLDEYRHALAHRIALYIPPYTVPKTREAAYRALQERMNEAIERRDFREYDRLNEAQDAMGQFRPVILHSFEEPSGTVAFHPQMLTDFTTIVVIAEKMIAELDGQS